MAVKSSISDLDAQIEHSNRSDCGADAAFPEDGHQPEFQPRHFRAGAK
ncbi:hypothetical protein [Rhizobium laguerreae]|nr:hypothetical protein [Rhizobium laguerreae]MBN9987654.1 hypothetical protein [Rhizobium laguerreae]MBY3305456.1 hypothetical protein [Rhizobium laguerreae]MBY3363380.1 hypothetical protein [Rhizobium laguerreae]